MEEHFEAVLDPYDVHEEAAAAQKGGSAATALLVNASRRTDRDSLIVAFT